MSVCVCVQGSQRELLNLSQQDYANRIEELNQSLKEAWASDQKVKALKIVIQVTQQLKTLIPRWRGENACLPCENMSTVLCSSALSSCPTPL